RRGARRGTMAPISIDRRSIERRTQDLLGEPFRAARFTTDRGPVGRWVARRGLATIPYLLNVIRYEMTWVGPRPESEDYVLRWKHIVPDYERRFIVLPGITGLAQVSGYGDADARDIARRAQYDLYYVDHRSLLLDVRTLMRTLMILLSGRRS